MAYTELASLIVRPHKNSPERKRTEHILSFRNRVQRNLKVTLETGASEWQRRLLLFRILIMSLCNTSVAKGIKLGESIFCLVSLGIMKYSQGRRIINSMALTTRQDFEIFNSSPDLNCNSCTPLSFEFKE